MATVVAGDFEWDDDKAEANERKHGVTFDEGATVFLDPNHRDFPDEGDAENIVTVGFSLSARILYVVTTERTERIRIISARRATPAEQRRYSER